MRRFLIRWKQMIPAAMISLLLISGPAVFADQLSADELTSGDFTYTVSGQSVTITKYNGSDETVTVPETIAGNPVNIVAEGAFSGNEDVKTVYLPEAFMGAEDGAFSDDQVIVYYEPAGDQAESEGNTQTASGDAQTSGSGSGQAAGNVADTAAAGANGGNNQEDSGAAQTREGIVDGSGRIISVNDAGNLILIENGTEYILDDTQHYSLKRDGSGNYYIRTEQGAPVDIVGGNTVEYTDLRGHSVSIDTETRMKTVTDPGNRAGSGSDEDASDEESSSDEEDADTDSDYEEPDWEDAESELTGAEDYLADAEDAETTGVRTSSRKNKIIGAAIIAAVLAGVAGFAFWYYRRR